MRKPDQTRRFEVPKCPHRMRHWFTYYGAPTSIAPVCQHGCGAPNPYASDLDMAEGWDAAELALYEAAKAALS